MSQRNKTQHDVHALPRRIVFGCLFPEKIDRFANRSVTKFNMRNDDAVHLVGHLRGAAHFPSPFVVSGGADGAVFSDRLLPGFLYFPKLPGTRLVVRFLAVLIFGVVDSFLAPARSSVVRIERQHPVVAFHRLVVLAGLIIAVGFGEQAFHFFDFIYEAGIHRFVEVTRLAQICDELLRLTAVRIVTV